MVRVVSKCALFCQLNATGVGENTNVTGTNVIASTNIKFSNPLTVGNGTDVTRNNISDLLAIGASLRINLVSSTIFSLFNLF
jgi:hypothetical protein